MGFVAGVVDVDVSDKVSVKIAAGFKGVDGLLN
jgi:hypothetical protein